MQEPRFLSLPPGEPDRPGDFGDRAVQLAELAGLTLDPWQQLVLRAMLRKAPRSDRWAAYESLLLVPRQNGKSVTLEAFDLAKLFLSPPGHLIMHTAHLFPTAMESFLHLTGLLRACPELWAEVASAKTGNGNVAIELKNGSRLRFMARGVNGSGRGFSPDDVVFDEAYRLPPEAEQALLYAISAKPNPQLVYASSTGVEDSETLWALVQRGRAGDDPSLMMAEWSADPDLDLTDEDQFWVAAQQANPALGFRLSDWKTAAEYRKALAQGQLEGFARERLGWWADLDSGGVFPAGSWAKCADSASGVDGTVMFGLDVSWDRETASIGIGGARPDGVGHMELWANRPGTGWIVPDLVELTAKNGGSVVVDPASPGGSLIEELKQAGVRVHAVTARDFAQACGDLYDAVRDREVRYLPAPELEAAEAAARRRDLAGGFAWNRRNPSADITPLVACTLALWGFRMFGDITSSVW